MLLLVIYIDFRKAAGKVGKLAIRTHGILSNLLIWSEVSLVTEDEDG